MVVRRVLWLLLCLVAGGPCAFLALEGVGVPIVAFALIAVVVVGKRNKFLPETLVAFGLPYTIEIVRFAVGDLVFSASQHDLANSAYFAAHIAVAGAILLSGCWMLLSRGASPHSSPRGGRRISCP